MFAWLKLLPETQLLVDRVQKKHTATNVRRFALERQAGGKTIEHGLIQTIATPDP